MRLRFRRHPWVIAASLLALASACGDGSGDGRSGDGDGDKAFAAQVASYELVAGRDQRFLAGIVGQGTGTVVSFGEVEFEFFYLGTRDEPVDPPESRGTATGTFLPIAGEEEPGRGARSREVKPSEGLGVYEATGVTFDAAGTWGVTVTATIEDETITANAPFSVRAEPRVAAPGMPVPRTDNPTIATLGPNSPALDSRASESEPVPDPLLHETSVAQALAEGRPVVVVISTPVYCVSRFCGPITDSVAHLATSYADRVAFVHIEVWEDFEEKKVNPAAREWLQPGGTGDLQEPWVFFVGADGIVKERFDNVASDAQLRAAVERLAATA